MNNAQFDRLFDAAFEAAESSDPQLAAIDHRPSWEKVRKRLEARSRRSSLRSSLTKIAIVAASILLGAAVFGTDKAAKAIEPLYATLKEYPSGILSFIFEREGDKNGGQAKTDAPPEFLTGLTFEVVNENFTTAIANKQQASKLVSFPAPTIAFVPEGFTLEEVSLAFFDGKEKADQADYVFDTPKGYYHVLFKKAVPGMSLATRSTAEGIAVESVKLSDGPGMLTTSAVGSVALETIARGVYISLSGKATVEETIAMYEGLYARSQ